ncbi:MAG: hypothetical protein ACK56I_03395, partial [bacterium]
MVPRPGHSGLSRHAAAPRHASTLRRCEPASLGRRGRAPGDLEHPYGLAPASFAPALRSHAAVPGCAPRGGPGT